MKALSIRQPWAWAIVHEGKDFENRSWPTRYRGPVLIHAAKGMTLAEWDEAMDFIDQTFPLEPTERLARRARAHHCSRGGIIGQAEIVDCVTGSDSPWFFGRYGIVLRNVQPLPFQPCRGALGFFDPDNPPRSYRIFSGRS
jgi:hypothetical protein